MKVVHVLYSGLGGHGNVFFSMVRANTANEMNIAAVFCGVEPLKEEYKLESEKLQVPYRYIRKKSGLHLQVYKDLIQAFEEEQPDIIFLHGSSFILAAYAYKRRHPHTKIFIRDTQASHLKNKREWMWLYLGFLLADKLIFLTKEAAVAHRNKFRNKVPEHKIHIVGNGLDIENYPTITIAEIKQIFTIGMQSRLQPIKDHPTLLKAFAMVVEQLKDKNLQLKIAGDGSTMHELKELAASLGLQEKVIFTGTLNRGDLHQFMLSLDLYIHASLGETMSTSIMQAMAYGMPIIASDVAGINNMIMDQKTGVLFPSQNAEALAKEMASLIQDAQKRKFLAGNARAYAEENFSNQVMFNRYKRIMQSAFLPKGGDVSLTRT